MVGITIDFGGFVRALNEYGERKERERLMNIARAHMQATLMKLVIFAPEDPDYYYEINSIETDIFTATTREHCQDIMERIRALAKKKQII